MPPSMEVLRVADKAAHMARIHVTIEVGTMDMFVVNFHREVRSR